MIPRSHSLDRVAVIQSLSANVTRLPRDKPTCVPRIVGDIEQTKRPRLPVRLINVAFFVQTIEIKLKGEMHTLPRLPR